MITPNFLTMIRLIIALIIPYALIYHFSLRMIIASLIACTLAAITDWFDGYLARKKSMITTFGKIADPIADKILVIGLLGTFCYFDLYHFFWIFFILLREISVTAVRLYLITAGKVIPAEKAGKYKVGVQAVCVYLTYAYWIALTSGAAHLDLFEKLHYVGIGLANLITVYSGILFLIALRPKNASSR